MNGGGWRDGPMGKITCCTSMRLWVCIPSSPCKIRFWPHIPEMSSLWGGGQRWRQEEHCGLLTASLILGSYPDSQDPVSLWREKGSEWWCSRTSFASLTCLDAVHMCVQDTQIFKRNGKPTWNIINDIIDWFNSSTLFWRPGISYSPGRPQTHLPNAGITDVNPMPGLHTSFTMSWNQYFLRLF